MYTLLLGFRCSVSFIAFSFLILYSRFQISFNHVGVKHILLSPNEEYLITWDGSRMRVDHDSAVIVWQVLTGKHLRAFPVSSVIRGSTYGGR